MNTNNGAAPVEEEKFLTPGVMVMLALMAVGLAFAAARFLFGIGKVANLSNQFPWGIWIGIDVASGVALAAGGFTTGAIAYVFNRDQYHAVIRPALLTAMLGYTFVVLGLLVDIGRYWNITSPMYNWNGDSVLLPFVLLLFKRIRQSAGWLFFASTVFVLGILLNRINVFVTSYSSPYKLGAYFPALGEIFITVGLIATLMFLYRVFVFIFPVLGAEPKKMSTTIGAVLVLAAASIIPWIPADARADDVRKMPLPLEENITPSIADAPKVTVLNSPVVNKYTDLYEPVRFMHSKHANVLGDCSICHHRMPREEQDRYGEPATMAKLRERKENPVACSVCHADPFNPQDPGTPGLKGAYHQLCMDCHQESEQVPHVRGPVLYSAMVRGPMVRTLDTRAPTDCLACHAKKVPTHNQLVKLEGNVDALAVTENCLSCHEKEGKAILKTAHWKWHGQSPYTIGHEKRVDLGKSHNTINNFCINLNGNWPRCTSCHIGYGWKDADFDFSDMSKIDCLVCHDTTGKYEKAPPAAGFPVKNLDLVSIAQNVGRPSRDNCGSNCHFRGGGGDAVKHGDMSSMLAKPEKAHDVHMGVTEGGLDFRCQDCHKTRNHMISGRSISVAAVEGDLSCEYCHTDSPHIGSELIDHHLNKHTRHVACQTCHIPVYSKGNPTKIFRDWSTAGQDCKLPKDKYGKPTYAKMKGSFQWKEAVKPSYKWYNGTVKRYLLGDRINENGMTELTSPVGSYDDPASRIYPFKVHKGKQISDAVYKYLITPKLWQGYWEHWDWDKASRDGMKSAGLAYSGKYEFVETVMYWGLTHEVVPKEQALSCSECHASLARAPYCGKCHQERPDVSFKELVHKGVDFKLLAEMGRDVQELIGQTNYIDYRALGYPGDPIETGGRFDKLGLGIAHVKAASEAKE